MPVASTAQALPLGIASAGPCGLWGKDKGQERAALTEGLYRQRRAHLQLKEPSILQTQAGGWAAYVPASIGPSSGVMIYSKGQYRDHPFSALGNPVRWVLRVPSLTV